MKRILSLLLIMFAAVTLTVGISARKKADGSAPKAELTERTYHFGTVKQSDKAVTHVFKIKNTGGSPLVIIDASASCGCTRPTYTDHPIKPGETGEVKVTFMPAGQRGEVNKEVKVKTNAPDSKRIILRITGSVIP